MLRCNRSRRVIAFCLLFAMIFSLSELSIPARAVDMNSGSCDNGFVSNINILQNQIDLGVPFVPTQRDYSLTTMEISVSVPISMTLSVTDSSGILWLRYYIDGTAYSSYLPDCLITTDSISKILTGFLQYLPNDGEPHTLTVQVGTKKDSNSDGVLDSNDDFEKYDIYNFNISADLPGIYTLNASNADKEFLTVTRTPHFLQEEQHYTAYYEGDTILLSAAPTTNTKYYIGETEYTAAIDYAEFALAPFKSEDGSEATIPIRLVSTKGVETMYYLHILPPAPQPTITQQPRAVTCNKYDEATLSVSAEPIKNGVLNYQWYSASGQVGPYSAVKGATESVIHPDTTLASQKYYYCVITETADGEEYSVTSSSVRVRVNIAVDVNPPEFLIEPGLFTSMNYNSYGWTGNYRTVYEAHSPFDALFFKINRPERGVSFSGQVYINTEPTYDGAELVLGSLSSFEDYVYSITCNTGIDAGTYYVGIIGTFSGGGLSASTESKFVKLTFTSTEVSLKGSGTETDPFLIATADDMAIFRDMVGAGNTYGGTFFKVTDDITLPNDWTSIGAETGFAGDLDGNGKTISYADGSYPLFEKIGSATIHDLTIYGKQINGCGLINGYYSTQDTLRLENITLKTGSSTLKSGLAQGAGSSYCPIAFEDCVVQSGVTVGYTYDQNGIGSFVGGLVGTLTNCQSGADVYGVSRVGGLAGTNANSMGLCTFAGCSFTGTVTATGNNAGGIIGRGYEDATAPNTRLIRIIDCTMTGTVSGVNNVGGLIGSEGGLQQSYDEASKGVVTGNTVTGTVTGTTNVGAIAGLYSHLDRYTVFENNTFPSAYSAFGKVYHVDTSAVQYGWHDGVFYFNSSATYTAEQLEEIYTALWTGWEDSGRWKPSSLITGRERNDNPLNCSAVMITIAVTTMPNKTEYLVGEAFDGTGMVVTLIQPDGTSRELSADEYAVSFDSSHPGEAVVTITFGTAVTTFTVNVSAPVGETITVKFSVLGDEHHEMAEGDKGHGLWLGGLQTWLPETEYTVSANATVFDLITQAFEADETLTFFSRYTESYSSEYIYAVQKGDVKLTEKDNCDRSGWMVAVNGVHVQVGVSNMTLADGDTVILHWSDDYLADEGAAGGPTAEDYQAAADVEDLIDEIGTVTLESEAAITAARTAYDALTDTQKALVTNYDTLTAAEARLAELKQAQADQQAAQTVIDAIAAIGEVTLEKEDAITAARAAYDALTDAQKALVTNYDTLTAAEARLAELKAEQQQTDQQAAQAVIDAIAAIGEVTLEKEDAITAARTAYDALTDAQKALVTNLDTLTAAEARLAELKEEQEQQEAQQKIDDANAKIAAIPDEITLESEEAILAARAAYDALTEEQKAQVTDYDKLLAAEAKLAELKFAEAKTTVKAENMKAGTIKLTWTEIDGAAQYKVLVSTKQDEDYTEASIVTGETFTYTKGKVGTRYYFKVVGISAEGKESAESNTVNKYKLPAQVTSLKATSKNKQVTLKWKKVTGAKKYFIYMSKNGKTGWKKVGTVTTNKFVYKKGTVGKKLYFKVQAVTANGKKGEFSAVKSIKVKK